MILQKVKSRPSKGSMTPMNKFKRNRILSNAHDTALQYADNKSPF